MKRRFVLAMALMLGGCAGGLIDYRVPLSRAGATYQDFMADRMACLQFSSNNGAVLPSRGIYLNCMATRGWLKDSNGFMPPAPIASVP